MKRRGSQERDEADAREQAESRREKLLAELKAREVADRQPPEEPSSDATPAEPEPSEVDPPAAEPDGGISPEEGPEPGDGGSPEERSS